MEADKNISLYNIDKIIPNLKAKDGVSLASDIAMILNEKRKDIIEKCFILIEKEQLIFFVEKTLNILNEGGMNKIIYNTSSNQAENKKSPGGIFFHLIKTQSGLNKSELKQLFEINYKNRRERKKILQKLQNVII